MLSARLPLFLRRTVSLAVIAGGLLAAVGPSPVQAQKADKKYPPEDKTLVTKSGINLKITYYPAAGGQDSPVVILLHGKSGNRLVWKKFAALLQQELDFAVVTVDLSGHGESGSRGPKNAGGGAKKADAGAFKPVEVQLMVSDDVETVKRFLYEEHQKQMLNMSKLAIVGADISASIALAFADFDWQKKRYDDAPTAEQQTPRGEDVRALILLSPEEQVPGLTVPQSAMRLKSIGLPAMIAVSKNDKLDKGSAKKIFDHLSPKRVDPDKQYVYLVEYDGKLRGTDLLNQDGGRVEKNMMAFLEKHLKPFQVDWRDRRSRLERDDDEDKKKK